MKKILNILLVLVVSGSFFTVALFDQTMLIHGNTANSQQNLEELQRQQKELEEEIKNFEIDEEKIKNNIEAEAQKIEDLKVEIEKQEAEIEKLEANIKSLTSNIKDLENKIIMRENEIKAKEVIIIERMKKDQSEIYFGNEIDFIMGSEDFATLVSTISILKDILDFENKQIQEIEKIIEVQNQEKEDMKIQQKSLEVTRENIELEHEKTKKTKEKIELVVAEFKKQELTLMAQKKQIAGNLGTIKNDIASKEAEIRAMEEAAQTGGGGGGSSGSAPVSPSGGFVRPISGGYISAGVWNYPASFGGGMHLGYDYAAAVGTPIYAAGNGVVLSSSDGCPTYGGLGNWCGSPGQIGGGNQVNLVINVGGNIYQVSYFHMQRGTPLPVGTIVQQGQVIGRLGSSGNSTGPHVHAEIIYLGQGSINDYVSSWNGDFSRGLGMTSAAGCEFVGHRAPCRLNPGEVWN